MTKMAILYFFNGIKGKFDIDLGGMDPTMGNLKALAQFTFSKSPLAKLAKKEIDKNDFKLYTTIYSETNDDINKLYGTEVALTRYSVEKSDSPVGFNLFEDYTFDRVTGDNFFDKERFMQRGIPLKDGKKQY